MTSHVRYLRWILALLVLLGATPSASRADAVLAWNEIAVTTLTTQTPPLNPFAQVRFAAIVQLAVFEAVNATSGEYHSYLGSAVAPSAAPLSAPFGSSGEAAAIAAAHAVLVNYFPGNGAALDAARAASLSAIPDGLPKTNGIAVGAAAAAALIALRTGDGAAPLTFYAPQPAAPGIWQVTPGCPTDVSGNPLGGTLLNWRNVRPFGVVQPTTGHWSEPFQPEPPPALTSNRYAKDYNEVKAVGGATSTARPGDRAVVARFYAASSPTFLFHTVARQLAIARGDSLAENARNLALLSIATNDSLVASFATKYHYDFWRPVTAIRAGASDGNAKTEPVGDFATFLTTPCFPSYPSNHASGSNAAAETLRRIYGAAGHGIELSATVTPIGPVTLKYSSLKQITNDVDDARVYAGIHFRFDQVAGAQLGREVATYVYKNNLRRIGDAD